MQTIALGQSFNAARDLSLKILVPFVTMLKLLTFLSRPRYVITLSRSLNNSGSPPIIRTLCIEFMATEKTYLMIA